MKYFFFIFAPNIEPSLIVIGILCAAEERQAGDISSLVPSHSYANGHMGSHQVLPRRSWELHRSNQLICPHHHVLILPTGSNGTESPALPMVEEIYHHNAIGQLRF